MRENSPDFKQSAFAGLIGIAEEDITPPANIHSRNWGAAAHDVMKGIHRPLLLTCISFQHAWNEKPLLLISADFGGWRSSKDGNEIRTNILDKFDIPASHLMFCLTHTHSGPVLSRDAAGKPGGDLIDPYLNDLKEKTIQVVRRALSSSEDGVLTWNYGKSSLATNRDLEISENTIVTGFNPGKTADDTLLVGRITNSVGQVTGTIVNYACHPTTLAWQNQFISPDYVGAMREVVTSLTKTPCLFMQGASGELSPRHQYVGEPEVADQNGRQLGYSVLACLEDMLPPAMKYTFDRIVSSGAELGVWKLADDSVSTSLATEMVEVAYTLKSMPVLEEIERRYHLEEDRVVKERLWRQRSIRMTLGDGETGTMNLWVWRLGNSLLIGQPNEAYSSFQIKIRGHFKEAVAVANLVNGSAGYLPPENLYDKHIYQVWQSPFQKGSLEQLTGLAIETGKKIMNAETSKTS